MTTPYLPPLDYSAPLSPANARQDRVAMSLGRWRLTLNSHSFEALQNNLHNHSYHGNHSRNHGRILCYQNRKNGIGWDVRGGQHTNISPEGAPLFSGRLRALRYPRGATDQPIDFDAKLNINPTRFAAQQFQFIRNPTISSFFKVSNTLDGYGEEPLSPCDNVLIGGPRHLFNYRPAAWPSRLQEYINGIAHIFCDIIQDASDEFGCSSGSFLPSTTELSVRFWQVETYWEFAHDSPLEEVHRLCGLASRSPFDFSIRPFEELTSAPEVSGIANSPCLTLRHRGGLIRIYAKTTNRIRFEVVYGSRTLRQRTGFQSQEVCITEANRFLGSIASSAASDLETIFRFLDNSAPPETSHNVVELAERVHQRSPSSSVASTILRMLGLRGCITMVPNTQMGQVITRLRRDGVLDAPQRCGQRTTYPLASEYREASQRLL